MHQQLVAPHGGDTGAVREADGVEDPVTRLGGGDHPGEQPTRGAQRGDQVAGLSVAGHPEVDRGELIAPGSQVDRVPQADLGHVRHHLPDHSVEIRNRGSPVPGGQRPDQVDDQPASLLDIGLVHHPPDATEVVPTIEPCPSPAPRPIEIVPSVLPADMARLGEECQALEKAGVDRIQWDVMDGHFVPNLTFGPDVIASCRSITTVPFEAHLMVERPDDLLDRYLEAGCGVVIVHAETAPHLHRTLGHIRSAGAPPGRRARTRPRPSTRSATSSTCSTWCSS